MSKVVAHVAAHAIQWKRCVPILTRLQGGDAAMRYLGGVTSVFLQSGGYLWSSREHPQDQATVSNMGCVRKSIEIDARN